MVDKTKGGPSGDPWIFAPLFPLPFSQYPFSFSAAPFRFPHLARSQTIHISSKQQCNHVQFDGKHVITTGVELHDVGGTLLARAFMLPNGSRTLLLTCLYHFA